MNPLGRADGGGVLAFVEGSDLVAPHPGSVDHNLGCHREAPAIGLQHGAGDTTGGILHQFDD